jgi:uncharacterized glyoxalase superfamily protein PhnB
MSSQTVVTEEANALIEGVSQDVVEVEDQDRALTFYDELRARGVEFAQPPVRQSWGRWSMFEDQEGNRFAIGPRETV